MDLPFIEFKLTDEVEGLQAIALVDRPAIGLNYQAFAPHKFEVINEDKRIVMGAAMIPDLPIYIYPNAKHTQHTTQTHPTCLLYTSPSPRDRTRSRMPSSA